MSHSLVSAGGDDDDLLAMNRRWVIEHIDSSSEGTEDLLFRKPIMTSNQ